MSTERPSGVRLVSAREGEEFVVRAGTPGDFSFVVDSWVRSIADLPKPPGSKRAPYLDNARRVARAMVVRERLFIACSPRMANAIFGWAVGGEGYVLHAFVRWDMRGRGMGRALVTELASASAERTG